MTTASSEAKERIDVLFHNWDGKTRATVFVRKEQLNGQSLDVFLQKYVNDGWFILVRKVPNEKDVFGLTFTKNSSFHYGSNPNFKQSS